MEGVKSLVIFLKRYRLLFIIFIFLLYFPYIYLFKNFKWEPVAPNALKDILILSFTQSFFSSVLTLLFGVGGSCGLFWLESRLKVKTYIFCEFFALLPALLPSIFIVVSVLNIVPHFPFGIIGIIILHVFSEVGMVSWIIKRLLSQKLSDLADWAVTTGASTPFFLFRVLPLIKKDMLYVFLILLFYFLTSFSIPLILGGHTLAGIEIAIFEKVMISNQWNQALSLFVYQCAILVFLLALILSVKSVDSGDIKFRHLILLEKKSGVLPLFLPSVVIMLSCLWSFTKGLEQIRHESEILDHWIMYIYGSLLVGFLSGGFIFILLTISSYFLQFTKVKYFFASLVTPSFVVLAFACHPSGAWSELSAPVLLSWALAIAFLPAVLRLGVLQVVEQLQQQIEMAYFLGASPRKIFLRITWPQTLPTISLMSGLTAIWAVGDFSLSRVVIGSDQTLAMWVHSLVEHYRWDSAQLLSMLILICGLVVFTFFAGVAYVCRQKLV